MRNINEILLKLEGFQYTTSPDLSMGYYHIQLSDNESNVCTIILPWGKYCNKQLPMGIANSPDIFQQKMNDLFMGLNLSVCTYKTFEYQQQEIVHIMYRNYNELEIN